MSTTGLKVSICRELDNMSNEGCDIMLTEIMSLLKCANRKKFIQKLLFNKEKEIFNNDTLNAMYTKSFGITKSDNVNNGTMTITASELRQPQTKFTHLPICILAKLSSFLCNNETFQFGETNRECYLSTQMTLYFKYRSDRNLVINDKSVICTNNGQMNIFNYSHCNIVEIDIKSKLIQSTFKQSVLIRNDTHNHNKIKPNKGLILALYNAKKLVVHSRNAAIIPINIIFDKNKSKLKDLWFHGSHCNTNNSIDDSDDSDDSNDNEIGYPQSKSPFRKFSKNYNNYFTTVCNSNLKCIRNLDSLGLSFCTSYDNSIADINLHGNFKKLSLKYTSGDHGNISLTRRSQYCNHFDRFIHSNLKEFSVCKFYRKMIYISGGPGTEPFDDEEAMFGTHRPVTRSTSTAGTVKTNAGASINDKSLRKLNIQLNFATNWESCNYDLEKMFTFWEKENLSQNIEEIRISLENKHTTYDDLMNAAAQRSISIADIIKHLIERIVANKKSLWQAIEAVEMKCYGASVELISHCFDTIWYKRNSLESNSQCNFKLFIAVGYGQVLYQVPWKKNKNIDEKQWKNKQGQFLKLMKLS